MGLINIPEDKSKRNLVTAPQKSVEDVLNMKIETKKLFVNSSLQ